MEAPGAYSFSLSPDDKTLYRILPFPHRTGAPSRIVVIDLATGRQRDVALLSAGSQFSDLSISQDGKTLGLIRYDEKTQARYLATVAVDGGAYREIYTFGPTEGGITWQAGFSWTKDSSGILFTRSVNEHLRQMIRVSIQGGAAEALRQEVPGSFQSIDLNPDGSRLAFGISRGLNEVWAFDNVLSVLK